MGYKPEYSGNHPRFSRRQEERYDAKMAHDKSLSDSARLHYLENDETHHPAKNLADSADIKDMSHGYNLMGDANDPAHPVRQEATWNPKREDMNFLMRGLDNLSTTNFNLGGGSQRKGDVFRYHQRHGGPTGSVNVHGLKQPGANFFPVEGASKGVDPSGAKLQWGPGMNSNQVGDYDADGDTMFHDYNQDGTMLGRGIKRIANWFKR